MNSAADTLVATGARTAGWARLGDFASLTKPRIVVMELITVAIAMQVASGGAWTPSAFWAAIIGAGLVAGSANALNMWIEQPYDAQMRRTRRRPLPAGRLAASEVMTFSAVTLVAGTVLLALFVNTATTVIGVACWLTYVALYTPMKRRTAWNTTVGAVSGALPILMGWTAGGGALDLTAWALVGVLFFWQYPHFMAIAWMYREDYIEVGYKMTTTVDPTGWHAGLQAVFGSIALWGVSILPAVSHEAVYVSIVSVLALVMLWPSIQFCRAPSDPAAKRLLRASLVYLPLWLVAFWMCW
ncbi:Protoheme IX farnesyltransferase 2 [Pirellulimonas nuda]|uniref:Protoheme IX farnesyltransferase n=1 Tax=Pirellulimonas nuda TaxID=2528009 RepID=A0A518D7I8_9BACT|nr:heme o synthase [Pirellulimonas nuda]QDU87416.1 Protoheme IX farnesyltransferase 2 [Pirellulimonas nuda]